MVPHTATKRNGRDGAAGMLADNFHDSIRGARRAAGAGIGPEAAAAFQAHRYTRLEIDLHSDTLSIRKTIGAGPLKPETYAARNAGRALVQSGVATHLNNNGPVTAPRFSPPSGPQSTPAANARSSTARAARASTCSTGSTTSIPDRHSRPFPGRRKPAPPITTTGTTADTAAHRRRKTRPGSHRSTTWLTLPSDRQTTTPRAFRVRGTGWQSEPRRDAAVHCQYARLRSGEPDEDRASGARTKRSQCGDRLTGRATCGST